jgi:hypothetical protein
VKKIIREANRIGRGGSPHKLKGVTDQFMILYKVMSKERAKTTSLAAWTKKYHMNLDQVVTWYGDPKDSTSGSRSTAPNGGYPWECDLICHYKAPPKSQRLLDDDGTSIRPGAEKSVQCMQLLLLMYTRGGPGKTTDVVWDPYGGSMSMGLACLTLGRTYLASEMHETVFVSAEARLRQFVAGRMRGKNSGCAPVALNTSDFSIVDAQVVTTLACRDLHNISLTMHPPNCDAEVTKIGALENHGGNLVIKQVPKEEMMSKNRRSMGQGVYTTVALKPTESLEVPMYAFGRIQPDSAQASRLMTEHPIKLRSHCLEGLLLVPAHNCLMRYINDSRGTGAKANVAVFEAQVEDLAMDEGFKLLEIIPISHIKPGAQLLLNFAQTFYTWNHADDAVTARDDDNKEEKKLRLVARNKIASKTGRSAESASASEGATEIVGVDSDSSSESSGSGSGPQ